MCRLQHSLGIVWRPQTPPLTAPTSNRRGSHAAGGPGGGAKQPCLTERKVPKHRLGPWVARGSARGYWGRLQPRRRAGRYRIRAGGGGRTLRLSSWGQGAGRGEPGIGCALQAEPHRQQPSSPALLPYRGLIRPHLLRHSPGY